VDGTLGGGNTLGGMDEAAVAALRDLYGDLNIDGHVLDLCGGGLHCFEVPPDELVEHTGDATELPYPDGAFDDVVCLLGPRNQSKETLAEVARVLKPGGHFVCSFVGGADDAGRMRKLRKAFDGTPEFGGAESDLRTSLTGSGDRLWAVWATRRP
jgi:SAM-dependent methyltransferase